MFSKGWEFVRPTLPFLVISKGASWSWLDGSWYYGSWIYYLGNQCLSPLKLGVSNPIHGDVYSILHYEMKLVSELRQVCVFLRVLRLPSLINWMPRYSLNIVENGFEHLKPNLSFSDKFYIFDLKPGSILISILNSKLITFNN